MSRLSAFCLIILAASVAFTGCNSSSDELPYEVPSSALVKSFSFSEDSKVLDNLDKVFFSIDLANARIFNADSMPCGTKINKLVPVITTGGASAIELVVPRPGQSDTTYNYLTNSTDSIDFSNGAVKLKIQSLDESVTMVYTVDVNVHKVKSDSLAWGNVEYSSLPTNLSSVDHQRAVKMQGRAYCMTSQGANYCMATVGNPASDEWATTSLTFSFKPVVESLRASSDALYILDDAGVLFKSIDGLSWTATSFKFDHLIGGYDDQMIGTVLNDGKWQIGSTDGSIVDAPADFPVTGASVPVEYGFPMSSSRQLTIVGGRNAANEPIAKSWGFDGSNWACLSTMALPEGLDGVTVTPYYTFEENAYWIATKESIFILIGGRNAKGECNTKTYISYNYGMTWKLAPQSMQMAANVPATYDAQTLLFSSILGSRASVAITSWECPYIYMFGGRLADGQLSNTVWRGVINRLSFKPLQ